MKTHTHKRWIFAAVLLPTLIAPITVAASYQVTVDTSSLGVGSYYIDIQDNPGDSTSQVLTALLSSFSLDGGSLLAGSDSTIGDVTGTLPGSLTFINDTALNDYYEGFTPGTDITFLLTLSGAAISSPNGTADAGSSFAISLYDSNGDPVLTDDAEGILGRIDVDLDGTLTVTSNPSSAAGAASDITFAPYEQPSSSIPEPATAVLVCTVGLALVMVKRLRS
jgi:hypothetical protein